MKQKRNAVRNSVVKMMSILGGGMVLSLIMAFSMPITSHAATYDVTLSLVRNENANAVKCDGLESKILTKDDKLCLSYSNVNEQCDVKLYFDDFHNNSTVTLQYQSPFTTSVLLDYMENNNHLTYQFDRITYKREEERDVFYLYFVQYVAPTNDGNGSQTGSGNSTEPVAEPAPVVQIEETKPEPVVPEPVKAVVQSADGTVLTSSVSSVYSSSNVNGAAVLTPANDIKASVGITEEGTNAAYYVCDNRNEQVYAQFKNEVETEGKRIYNLINSDMYKISKHGVVERIYASDQPVKLMFGLPASIQGKKVSIIAQNKITGEYVEFQDTDDDPTTITIDATIFGTYAIVVND